MAVRTNEEWEKVKDTFLCPGCGKSDGFDID
jgi:rubredoxin